MNFFARIHRLIISMLISPFHELSLWVYSHEPKLIRGFCSLFDQPRLSSATMVWFCLPILCTSDGHRVCDDDVHRGDSEIRCDDWSNLQSGHCSRDRGAIDGLGRSRDHEHRCLIGWWWSMLQVGRIDRERQLEEGHRDCMDVRLVVGPFRRIRCRDDDHYRHARYHPRSDREERLLALNFCVIPNVACLAHSSNRGN